MIKQQIYKSILARRSGMDYIPGMQFQKSLINMDKSKSLTMSNQPERNRQNWCRCGSIKHLRLTSKDYPVGLEIRKAKTMVLGMGLSQYEAKKAVEDAAVEEERKCLEAEAAGEGEKSDEGASSGNVV